MSTAIADVTLRDRDAVLRLERTTRPAQGSFTLFMYTLHDGTSRGTEIPSPAEQTSKARNLSLGGPAELTSVNSAPFRPAIGPDWCPGRADIDRHTLCGNLWAPARA
jgi:hypothetical protein